MSKGEIVLAKDRTTLKKNLGNDEFLGSLTDVLPKHVTAGRMVKMTLIAASRTPRLFECTMNSIYAAVIRSAELGLDCSGTLNSAHLVPFYNKKINAYEAVFIPGYGGMIDLARRSGEVGRLEAHVVYDGDEFEYRLGTDPVISHVPMLKGKRGKVYAAYALAETHGTTQVEVMTVQDLEAIRQRSKAKDKGPWVTDWNEMARKTVVKRLVKYLPLSPEKASKLHEAIDEDNRTLGLAEAEIVKVEDADDRKAGDRLADQLGDDDAANRVAFWDLIIQLAEGDKTKEDALFEEIVGKLDIEATDLKDLNGEALDAATKEAESRLKK